MDRRGSSRKGERIGGFAAGTPEEAKRNLPEAVRIRTEEMAALGTLDDYPAECGYLREGIPTTATTEKIRRLQQYLSSYHFEFDPVPDMALDKLFSRELERLEKITRRLSFRIKEFENRYELESSRFQELYEKGEMGDSVDFIEWSRQPSTCWKTRTSK